MGATPRLRTVYAIVLATPSGSAIVGDMVYSHADIAEALADSIKAALKQAAPDQTVTVTKMAVHWPPTPAEQRRARRQAE